MPDCDFFIPSFHDIFDGDWANTHLRALLSLLLFLLLLSLLSDGQPVNVLLVYLMHAILNCEQKQSESSLYQVGASW